MIGRKKSLQIFAIKSKSTGMDREAQSVFLLDIETVKENLLPFKYGCLNLGYPSRSLPTHQKPEKKSEMRLFRKDL